MTVLKKNKALIFLLLISCALLHLNSAVSADLDSVTLQLKWKHQFQFAGYYAAKEKGFYQQAGLDVTFNEASAGIDPTQEVISGRAQFGVGTSELILTRFRGAPVVVLGVIFQHSPLGLVALADSGIDNIHKLAGRKVMIEPNSAEFFAYLQLEGIAQKTLDLQHHSFDLNDLLTGQTEAMSIYVTDELYLLKQSGKTYYQFLPRMGSIDFYGDNFFTLATEIKTHPQRVKAFRAATLKGWHYAMQHPEEIIQLIYQRYSQRHSIEHLRFEAKAMQDLMQPELIEPGYMTTGRWQYIAQSYWQLGLLPEHFAVEAMLYSPDNNFDLQKLQKILYFSVAGLALLSALSIIFFHFYRRAHINEKRLNTMIDHAPISVIVLDENNLIQSWNAEAEHTFQWQAQDAIGKNILFMVSPDCRSDVEAILNTVHKEHTLICSENTNLKQDGSQVLCEWLNAPFKDQYNKSRFIICMAQDITEKKHLQRQLEQAAHYDNLTSLPNRALILELLKKSLAIAARQKTKLALLFLDLNDFKKINDTLGHDVGDTVLTAIAERLPPALRSGDYVGRLAGDEFLIILQDVGSTKNAHMVTQKLHQLIQQPVILKNKTIHAHASIGISLYPDDCNNIDALVNAADQAMYRAKRAAHENDKKNVIEPAIQK